MAVSTTRELSSARPLHELGSSRCYHWRVNAEHVDMAMSPPAPRPIIFAAAPQNVTLDLERTALIIIDMQNDFCAKGGWVDHLGADYSPDRAPIEPLQRLLPSLRARHVPIVWVNWGNRPDLMNMPPNQLHLYKPTGVGIGLGEPLPGSGAHVLEKDSWAAAVVDELRIEPGDIRVDKYRISGFWDTPLDFDPQEFGLSIIALRRCQHRSVRARIASPMRTSLATAASCSPIVAPPPRRNSAPTPPSGTSRNASASLRPRPVC